MASTPLSPAQSQTAGSKQRTPSKRGPSGKGDATDGSRPLSPETFVSGPSTPVTTSQKAREHSSGGQRSQRSKQQVNIMIAKKQGATAGKANSVGNRARKGVTRALERVLQPDHVEHGGKPVQATLFTKNGFVKRKIHFDNLEKQNRQLVELWAESRKQALAKLNVHQSESLHRKDLCVGTFGAAKRKKESKQVI